MNIWDIPLSQHAPWLILPPPDFYFRILCRTLDTSLLMRLDTI